MPLPLAEMCILRQRLANLWISSVRAVPKFSEAGSKGKHNQLSKKIIFCFIFIRWLYFNKTSHKGNIFSFNKQIKIKLENFELEIIENTQKERITTKAVVLKCYTSEWPGESLKLLMPGSHSQILQFSWHEVLPENHHVKEYSFKKMLCKLWQVLKDIITCSRLSGGLLKDMSMSYVTLCGKKSLQMQLRFLSEEIILDYLSGP